MSGEVFKWLSFQNRSEWFLCITHMQKPIYLRLSGYHEWQKRIMPRPMIDLQKFCGEIEGTILCMVFAELYSFGASVTIILMTSTYGLSHCQNSCRDIPYVHIHLVKRHLHVIEFGASVDANGSDPLSRASWIILSANTIHLPTASVFPVRIKQVLINLSNKITQWQ